MGYDFEYHIYGEGEKYNEYDVLIKKYGLGKNILLKGYSNDIQETMNSFDLFVLPSRYEGIPYVILEAMKASVPIITTDVGGINEVIKNMINGILINNGNAKELAEKILLLYDSKPLRMKLSENAEIDFREKYTVEKTIESIESVYSYHSFSESK